MFTDCLYFFLSDFWQVGLPCTGLHISLVAEPGTRLLNVIVAISKSYVFVNTRIWCRSSSQLKGYEIVHTILLLQVQRMLIMEIYKILNILKSYYLNNKYLLNCWEFTYTFSIESFEYQIGSKSDQDETYFNRYGTFKKFDIIWFLKLVQVIQALCIWFTFSAARNIIKF